MTVLFFVFVFVAVIIGSVLGFGTSTILQPIAAILFPFKTAIILTAITHLFGNLSRAQIFRKNLDWPIVFYFGIPSIVAAIVGAFFLVKLPQNISQIILGIFLILYGGASLFWGTIRIPQNKASAVTGGVVSGLITGIIGVGGPVRSAFLNSLNLKKEAYLATTAVLSLLVDVTRIPVYLGEGFLPSGFIWYLPVLAILGIGGSLVSSKIAKKAPPLMFKRIVLIGIVAAGIWLILRA